MSTKITIKIESSNAVSIGVYNGVDDFTECEGCHLLNIRCSEDGAPELCEECQKIADAEEEAEDLRIKKLITCIACDRIATYTIQAEGGRLNHYCTKHFNATIKEINKLND